MIYFLTILWLQASNCLDSQWGLMVNDIQTDCERERLQGDIESKRVTSDGKSYFDLYFTNNNPFLCDYWQFSYVHSFKKYLFKSLGILICIV